MPFIPPRLRSVLLVLSPALLTVAQFVPAPVGPILGILAFVSGGLAGLAMRAPKWVAGAKSYIPVGMVGAFLTVAGMLESLSQSSSGPVALAMTSAALLLTFLAGRTAPAPEVPAEEARPVEKSLEPTPAELAVNVDELLAASRAANVDVVVREEDKAA